MNKKTNNKSMKHNQIYLAVINITQIPIQSNIGLIFLSLVQKYACKLMHFINDVIMLINSFGKNAMMWRFLLTCFKIMFFQTDFCRNTQQIE